MSTTTADTMPTVPPADLGQRWGLFHRANGDRRWALIVTVGSEAMAWDTMHDLMRTTSGDWSVRRLEDNDPAAARRPR